MRKRKNTKKDNLLVTIQENDRKASLKALMHMKYVYLTLFVLLIIHLLYFIIFSSGNLVINSYNPRLDLLEENIIRGKILDRNGEILAETVEYDEEEHRVYPYENAFSHIVGYSHQGKTGIEALADIDLLQSNMSIYDQVIFELKKDKRIGDNVVTTLDKDLQLKAHELMGNQRGAIVAIEPSTGKILCMVSKPDFNPNEIVINWEDLINDEENSPLLNRATQGLYPPGSTFKILTAAEYLIENDENHFAYTCTGEDDFDGKVIHCYNSKAHGDETLSEAFTVSCNTAFATLGNQIDIDQLNTLANQFLFNQSLPYSLPYSMSSFTLTSQNNSAQKAETVIGQGETLITPLHNLLITSAIANGGFLMKPYLIDHTENYKGKSQEKNMPDVYDELLGTELSRTLTEYMMEVMQSGTGKQGASDAFIAAGKTGSAENPFGDAHGWFVGFAPAEDPQIAISVIIENSGGSSHLAVPIANALFEYYIVNESSN